MTYRESTHLTSSYCVHVSSSFGSIFQIISICFRKQGSIFSTELEGKDGEPVISRLNAILY